MSGICGILRLDGAPPEGIEAMTKKLQQRGPEGTQHFRDGISALGHTLLATTPEALHETMPLTHTKSGCTITADVRLDNREVLLPQLGLESAGRVVGDGEIILHAYLKWGEDCPLHLLGDFAFAIWDPRTHRMFAARDHMGMKQLIHCHVEGKLWAFASEPQAVLLADGVPRKINEGRIADFLEEYLEDIDNTSTFFKNVFRLPPAHYMTVDDNGLELRRYWTLKPGVQLRFETNNAYAAAFREVFTQAVRCRLRVNGPVGSMLSGGMDSGSVVAIASRLLAEEKTGPLHTFSGVGPNPATCIETRTIHTAQTLAGLVPHTVDYSKLAPWIDDLVRQTREIAEPFDAHMVLLRAMYIAAQRQGVRVMLDGVAGDLVLTDGSQMARLIRRGRLWQAWREARGTESFFGAGRGYRTMYEGLREALAPDWARRIRALRRKRRYHLPTSDLLADGLANRIGLASRVAKYHALKPRQSQSDQRAGTISDVALTVGRERYDRVASASGIEPRDPFMDIRVVQFCLDLPPEQVERDGWRKMILRRAMDGLLPDKIRWRKGKEHLGGDFIEAIFSHRMVASTQENAASVNLSGISNVTLSAIAGQDASKTLTNHKDLELLALVGWLQNVSRHLGVELSVKGN